MTYFNTYNLDKKVTLVIKLNRKLNFLNNWIAENKNSPLHAFDSFKIQYNKAIVESEVKTRVLNNLHVLNY